MVTSSTLKTLKQQDGPLDVSNSPAPARSNGLAEWFQALSRSIWRRRWMSVTAAWLVCALGWATITLWPTNFVASAVIYADLAELAAPGAVTDGPDQTPVALLKSMLASDEAMAEVRDDVPLDPLTGEELRSGIMVRSTVPPVFVLAYEHRKPEVAQKVIETVITRYQDSLEAASIASSQEARELDDKIAEHERRLQTAEADLVAFRRGNDDYLRGSDVQEGELALMGEEIADLEKQVRAKIVERDGIATRLAQAREPSAEIDPSRSAEEIEAERKTLEAELAKLKERYADTHPYVNAVVDTIIGLEAEALAVASVVGDDGAADQLPEDREELERRHEGLITEVSDLSSSLGDKRREFDLLQALTKTVSSVEAELAELEVERDTLRTTLSDLQRRRDELGEQNGGEAEQEPFRLIKPPELPTDPVGPSRLMALAAVLFGGAGLGASAAVISNRFKGVFESAWQLRKRFDVGVLGTISEVMSPAEKKQLNQSRLVFGLACLALVGVFSGLAIAELTNRLAPLGEHLRTQLLG